MSPGRTRAVTTPALTVVKLGGGLSHAAGALERVARAVAAAARRRPLVVVPGGGPFADAVRAFDRRAGLSPSASHWMAILAMDQYAYAVADKLPGGVVVTDATGIQAALASGRVPVLAPSRWLLAADVLPHRWDATSDSIAAFVAGALDAALLVLFKPVPGTAAELADPHFREALPAGLPVVVLSPAEADRLDCVMAGAG
jgi:aspartokinase-like uncharacterized kinase